jgi:hypothetical protein
MAISVSRTLRERRALVIALALTSLSLLPPRPAVAQNLDGYWLSEGYGYFIEIEGATLKVAEVTAISCVPAFTATRQPTPPGALASFKITDGSAIFRVLAGDSDQERRLHPDGAASDIIVRRISTRPPVCDRPTPDTPQSNFDVFAATWAEQYGFFDLKRADWKAIVARNRANVSTATTPATLFEILKGMVEPFEDAHTSIRAPNINQTWSGTRKSENWLERPERARALEVIDQKYLRTPLRSWCNGQLQYALLDGGVGYFRLRSFSRYGAEPGFESGRVALEAALDAIFAEASKWPGLIIDVRINGGGSDPYGLAIAARLATAEYLAYSKQARSDPADPRRWSKEQPSLVRPSSRPSFKGRVIVLTGVHSVSAAETFTQALAEIGCCRRDRRRSALRERFRQQIANAQCRRVGVEILEIEAWSLHPNDAKDVAPLPI